SYRAALHATSEGDDQNDDEHQHDESDPDVQGTQLTFVRGILRRGDSPELMWLNVPRQSPAATCCHVLPLRTLSGCSATMSEPRSASSSFAFTRSHWLPPV